MAVRRSLIDLIDKGLDPKIAHNKLDKSGKLISGKVAVEKVLTSKDVKENLILDEKKPVLTESSQDEEENESESEKKSEKKSKKQDKTPKLV